MSFEELKGQVCQIGRTMVEVKGLIVNTICQHPLNHSEFKKDIIVVGGYDGVNRLDSAEMFIWSEKKWLPLHHTNKPRSILSSAVYKNQVLVAGGRTGEHSLTNSIETMHLDRQPAQWIYYPAWLPYPCSGHSCTIYQDRLIVIGGINVNDGKVSDGVYEVLLTPPYSTKLLSQMPQARNKHQTACFGDKIVIIGGTDYRDYGNCVLLFDIKTNKCKPISPLPYGVSGMTTVAWGDHVVIIGGRNDDGEVLNSVMMYNVKTGHTNMLPPMKYGRVSSAAVVAEDIIVVMGGLNSKRGQYLNVVEYFSFASYSWTDLPPMNERRSCAAAVVKPGN